MRRFVVVLPLVLSACTSKPPVEVKVDPALAMLVPADAVLLVGARVEALEKTPVFEGKFPPVEDFAKKTGIDPRKDLRELLFVSNGKQGVLLGRGKFANQAEPHVIGNAQTAVAFIDSSTAAVGEAAALKSLVDRRENSHGPAPALAALMKEIPPDSQIWAAYTRGATSFPFGSNANKLLSSLESGSLYLDLRKGLNGVALGLCSTDQEAQDVQGALKLLIALGQLDEGIRVTRDGRRVKLNIDEPPEQVEKLLDLWLKR